MPKDPLSLFHLRILLRSPTLYLMAFVGFSISSAVIFPPGALSVEGRMHESVQTQLVEIFDPSFMGNGSVEDALSRSLLQSPIYPLSPYLYVLSEVRAEDHNVNDFSATKPFVSATARNTLITGELPVLASPCGPNCTYQIEFEGPQVKCSTHNYNDTAIVSMSTPVEDSSMSELLPDWVSDWTPHDTKDKNFKCPPSELSISCDITGDYYDNFFFEWYTYDTSSTNIVSNGTTAVYQRSVSRLECIPGYARYNVNFTFGNGIPAVEINTTFTGSLVDVWQSAGRHIQEGEKPGRWVDPQGLVEAANIFAVMTSFIEPLKGQIGGSHAIYAENGTIVLHDFSPYEENLDGSMILSEKISRLSW